MNNPLAGVDPSGYIANKFESACKISGNCNSSSAGAGSSTVYEFGMTPDGNGGFVKAIKNTETGDITITGKDKAEITTDTRKVSAVVSTLGGTERTIRKRSFGNPVRYDPESFGNDFDFDPLGTIREFWGFTDISEGALIEGGKQAAIEGLEIVDMATSLPSSGPVAVAKGVAKGTMVAGALMRTAIVAKAVDLKYARRVRARGVEDPTSHNFPYSFDKDILSTKPIPKKNGYNIYHKKGAMKGKVVTDPRTGVRTQKYKEGVFEIGVTKDGIIDHRFFRPKG
ncbi:hypothetical protein A9Q98_14895 [Thalassotalea sp. 42_200_T64]|nr:hypothetical protein A9Q98_14895 [Thalassotalea sp. 42_200_T64]